MLYSLDTVEPDDMARHLTLGTVVPKKIFEGRYTLVGKTVHVEVSYYSPIISIYMSGRIIDSDITLSK